MASMYTTILAALSILIAPAAAAQGAPVQDRAANGIALARRGNLADAERELRAAVAAAPSVAVYRAQLGSVLGLESKWNEALKSFQKAVQLDPQNLDFRRETAAVQWQMGLMPAAESNLHYVLEKLPKDPGALLLLGLVKEKTGDYAKAAQLLDSQFQLVAAQPERTVAFFHAAIESGQTENISKIIDVLQLHVADKSWSGAVAQCMQFAIVRQDLPTTEKLFSLLPADDPAHSAAAFQLARLFYSRAQVSRAKDLLLQLKSQGVDNADLESLLGNCLESERQSEQAIDAYRRAIAADPSHVERYEDLISLLLYQRKTADALLVVNQALTVDPNDSRPWVWKGNVDLGRNDYKDAMKSYTRAVELDKKNPDALFGVAGAYYVTGQGQSAIATCESGISRFPKDPRFYVSYAEMLLASPDAVQFHPKAKDLLEKALKLAPDTAQAHYLLGQIALQEGQLKEAEDDYLRSLRSDPDRSKTHFALSRVYRRTGRAEQAATEFALYEKLKQAEESGGGAANTTPEKQ